jgi:hypothetical protein
MMIFILTVHSVSLILIYTVTLIALRSYSNAFWYTSFMVCPPGAKIVALLRKRNNVALHRNVSVSIVALLRNRNNVALHRNVCFNCCVYFNC